MTTALERLRAWNRTLDDPIDVRALAVLRIAIGPILLLHLRPFLSDALDGVTYADRFTLPFWSWYPELPEPAYVALLWITAAAGVLLSIGLLSRLAAWVALTGVAYNLFLSQTHFHHNRAFLVILLSGIAVLPAGRTVSVDAMLARRRGAPLDREGGHRLGLLVLRFSIALVYFASGFSKLLDPDWWGGTVTRLRIEHGRERLADTGLPEGLVDLLADPGFQAVAAKVIVLTELFIAIGLLVPRMRKAAVWVAIIFHVSIEATASVQVFSLAAVAALVVWVDRASYDRLVEAGGRSRLAIRALDWTGRFGFTDSAGSLVVRDRGRARAGADARWFVLSRLPLTFWFAAPVLLARSVAGARRGRIHSAPHPPSTT